MTLKFRVKGMTCTMCSSGIEKSISNIKGVTSVKVTLLNETMLVECGEEISTETIIKAVDSLGYKAFVYGNKDKINNPLKKRFLFSASLLIPLLYLSMGKMLGFPLPQAWLNYSFQLVISGVILIINYKFFTMGIKAIINRFPNMDTLVALGASSSYIFSAVLLILYATKQSKIDHLFFESSAMVVTLVTLGKWLEERSKKRTGREIEKLSKMIPDEAVIIEDEKETIISTSLLKSGDVVVFKSGDYICVDGKVLSGSAYIDKSALTGESLPVEVLEADSVSSGSILKSGYLKVIAEKTGDKTLFSKMIDLVQIASSSKSPFQKYADKVAKVFVPVICVTALITFIIWLIATKDGFLAFNYGISVLVISCPCALGLATPVAVMATTGKAASLGVLYKDAEALQKLANINVILLDKTATITVGKPKVVDALFYDTDQDLAMSVASAIEEKSSHPIADCIREYCGKSKNDCFDYEYIPGKGAVASINGRTYKLGNRALIGGKEKIEKEFLSKGMTTVFLSHEEKIIAMFVISDYIKSDSKEAIKELNQHGLKTIMVTGDNGYAAQNIADLVGIKDYVYDVLPEEKAEVVKKYTDDQVAFVGDGINDSIALKTADVGVAIGTGSDIAIDSSDVVLVGGSLKSLANAFVLSKKAVRIIKENLFWAFFYNVIAIPIAAGAFSSFHFSLTPSIAAACMSLSSLFVVLNALRITAYKGSNPKLKLKKIWIDGMMCEHCAKKVTKALKGIGIKTVKINLEEKSAIISYEMLDDQILKNTLEVLGYNLIEK